MKLIENYEKALQDIYDHVGFVEDWVIYPIDNSTKYVWRVDDEVVKFADNIDDFNNEDGNYYENELYKQRFYQKWIYEGELFTLVFCDSHVDGMKYFRLFDNSKKVTS